MTSGFSKQTLTCHVQNRPHQQTSVILLHSLFPSPSCSPNPGRTDQPFHTRGVDLCIR